MSGGVLACLRQLLAWRVRRDGSGVAGVRGCSGCSCRSYLSLLGCQCNYTPAGQTVLDPGHGLPRHRRRLFGGVIRLDGTFRLICAFRLIDAVQSGFVQRGVAGVGVLAGHVCLVETSSISPVLLSGAETMTGNPVSAVRTARAAYTGRRLDERLVKEERRVGRLSLLSIPPPSR